MKTFMTGHSEESKESDSIEKKRNKQYLDSFEKRFCLTSKEQQMYSLLNLEHMYMSCILR